MSPLIWTEFRPDLGKFDEFQHFESAGGRGERRDTAEVRAATTVCTYIPFDPSPTADGHAVAARRRWFMARVG